MNPLIIFLLRDSSWPVAVIYLLVFLVVSNIIMLLTVVIAIFYHTIYRNPRKRRSRECTDKKDESQMRMFAEGISWAEQYKDITVPLHISNEGLNLYGEYIDFGCDKCAVILPGRTESLLYSYYFTDVYAKNGYNILVIDVRAHGLSDGKYQTAGIKESDDLIVWINLIHTQYGIGNFVLHGICVGGATAIYAYVKLKNEGSTLVRKIVTDGLYQSYYEIFKRHFKKLRKPAFPALQMVFFLSFVLAGVRFFKETPLKYMKEIDIPILFIWSAKDIFCTAAKSEELFQACASAYKEVCFFPEGRHSHVRSAQAAAYDQVIERFLI